MSDLSEKLYKGNSVGFAQLCDGYGDYAEEVISNRALPDIRDGLKPVGRRIIYTAYNMKIKDFVKSLRLQGQTSTIHPHGETSVYEAMCLMTDKNGSYNVPIFTGQGNFGVVYSKDPAAAARYTELKSSSVIDLYMRDMDACNFVPDEIGDGVEPEVLPVRFPASLVNGSSGLAVSVSTNIPSFNFHDVIDATCHYLKHGSFSEPIIPDFPTGGIIVNNKSEMLKIYNTGKGKIKVRAKVEINGKHILVKEVPFGKTVQSIEQMIKNSEIYGISDVRNAVGLKSTDLIDITCKSKSVVQDVLKVLYGQRILQNTISSNMVFVESKKPIIGGVCDVIVRWVSWRKKVCTLKFTKLLDSIKVELEDLDYFIRLISNDEWRDTFVDKAIHKNKVEALGYLSEIFPDIPEGTKDWIYKRSLPSFNNGGRYLNRYNELKELRDTYQSYLDDIGMYIYQDLQELQQETQGMFLRKSEVTDKDYIFSKISDKEYVDDSYCTYIFTKDGFLKKTRDGVKDNESDVVIEGYANSTLIGFDNMGMIIRIAGEEIPFTKANEKGIYIPRYLGFDLTSYEDEYKILYLDLLQGKKLMLLYTTGYVSFLDFNEFIGKKRIKVVQNGVSPYVGTELLDIIDVTEGLPEFVTFYEYVGGTKEKIGIANLTNFSTDFSRKSRRRLVSGSENISSYALMSYHDLINFVSNSAYYTGKMKYLKEDDLVHKEGYDYGFVEGKF